MKKRKESGFALLLVFLMAAVISITLFVEIPRVAFEAQRQKEQLLIERGEQYKRAIQLFVKANQRYPGKIEDLENFNNRRFLRHRFVDPMTGKDDWRLVHINNGVLTDSVVTKQKPLDPNQTATTAGQYVGEQASIGSTLPQGQQGFNTAQTRRRASEGGVNPAETGPDGQPFQPLPGVAPYPGQPPIQQVPVGQTFPGVQPFPGGQPLPGSVVNSQQNPGAPVPPELQNFPGGGNFPGQPIPGRFPAGVQFPGMQPPGGQPNPGGQGQSYVGGGQAYVGGSQPYVGGGNYIGSQPNQPAPGGNPVSVVPGQVNPQTGQPNFPGLPGGQPNFAGGLGGQVSSGFPQQGQNPAANLINGILTNPRPAPTDPQAVAQQPMGQQIGGGIAGVASKLESGSIMLYNQRAKYNEWEFIFDYTKQKLVQNPNAGTIGTPAANLGSMPGSPGFNPTPNGTSNPAGTPNPVGNTAPNPDLPRIGQQ